MVITMDKKPQPIEELRKEVKELEDLDQKLGKELEEAKKRNGR